MFTSNTTKLYELGKPTVQAKPIWTIFRNITNGVASEWSEPVKWLGEGTPVKMVKMGRMELDYRAMME